MTVTAQQLKSLRERTGVGMAKCKEALEQTNGDIEEAINVLRKSGFASAIKKEERETKEGMIAYFEAAHAIGLAQIVAETDFVVKNEKFQKFAAEVTEIIATKKIHSIEALLQERSTSDKGLTISELRALLVQTIGENVQIARIACLEKKPSHSFGIYSHMGGKILTLVELQGQGEASLAKDIAMHVAACSPEYKDPESVPETILEKEREIAREQLKGKPAFMMDKIVQGKVDKFFQEQCLLHQPFVKDSSMTIEQLLQEHSKKTGKPISLVQFSRWAITKG